MKIMITGNMGYIGPVVTKHLRTTIPDSIIIGLDTAYFGNCMNSVDVLPESNLDIQYYADIRKVPEHMLEGVDAVVHLSGISNDPIGNRFEEVTLDINHKASIRLAEQARKAGVSSFIFASSCSMYGSAEGGPRTEDSELNPLTAYARSKVYTERDLKPLATGEFKVTCLRFSTACGMSDRLRLDLVLNDFVAAAVTSKRIQIFSDGTPWRPLIDVKDMARAIEWAIGREAGNGGVFLAVNVGSNEWIYQVRDLAEAVAAIIPGVDISINKDAQPDKRSYRVNFDLFRKLAPNHQPKCDLPGTIRELEAGLKEIKFNDPNFHNSRYIRLKVLSDLLEKGLLDQQLQWQHKR